MRILGGEEPTTTSVNEVRELPDNFKGWVNNNQERLAISKTMPYFVRDNFAQTYRILDSVTGNYLPPTLNSIEQRQWNKQYKKFNEENLTQGLPMSIEQALGVSEEGITVINPHFRFSANYQHNCATCVVAYDMRRRGFDVEALPNMFMKDNPVTLFSLRPASGWLNLDGSVARYTNLNTSNDILQVKKAFGTAVAQEGTYSFEFKIKGFKRHVIIVERDREGIHFIAPQYHKHDSWGYWAKKIDFNEAVNLMRIDNKAINADVAMEIIKKR